MKLYYTKRSPYARKAKIIALEKGIELDYIVEDLQSKSSELLAVNPVGKIPVLVTGDGQALCDSPVICEYLDGLTGEPRFFPGDSKERLKVVNLAAIADGLMDVTVSIYMEQLVHAKDINPKFIESRSQTIERCLKYFEERLGDLQDFHYASVALAAAIGYIEFRVPQYGPKHSTPKLAGWYEVLIKRMSLQQSAPAE